MEARTLLCKKCRNVFKLSPFPVSSQGRNLPCPKCGSVQVVEAPAWAPMGSGLNIFESSDWEYECQECRNKFKMPIPKSPSEQKARRCTSCGSGHLHVLTIAGGEPLYCG